MGTEMEIAKEPFIGGHESINLVMKVATLTLGPAMLSWCSPLPSLAGMTARAHTPANPVVPTPSPLYLALTVSCKL